MNLENKGFTELMVKKSLSQKHMAKIGKIINLKKQAVYHFLVRLQAKIRLFFMVLITQEDRL